MSAGTTACVRRGTRHLWAAVLAATMLVAVPGLSAAALPRDRQSAAQHWRLDPTFGSGGLVLTDFQYGGAPSSGANAMVVQPDGEILAAGYTSDLSGLKDMADVARYRPDGTLDSSFGNGGRVMLGPHALYVVDAIALQEINGQQKIVLGVSTTFLHPLRFRCSVIRLNPDGSLDTDHDADPSVAFGDEGIKVIRFARNSGFCPDLTVGTDGSIVGVVQAGSHRGDIGVFRLQAENGALDPSFGADGKMTLVSRGFQVPNVVTLQPRAGLPSRVLVGGLVSRPHGYDWAIWRITPDGHLERTFGHHGRVVTTMRDPQVQQSFDSITGLAVTPDRAIVAVGDYRAWPSGANYPEDTVGVVRYRPDGTMDTSFGDGGRVHLPYDGRAEVDPTGVTLDDSGRILFSGAWEAPTYGRYLFGGLTPDGSTDTRFGKAGFITFAVRGGYDAGNAVTLDDDGRLLVAGRAGDPHGVHDEFGVARLALSS